MARNLSQIERFGVRSDDREGDSADFLIDLKGIDVRHATNIVDDGHETRFQVWCLDVVLAADATDEVLGVETLRVDGGADELLQ